MRIGAIEACLLVMSLACQSSPRMEAPPLPLPSVVRAGPFGCAGSECRQTQPRLPDTGEWTCAERDGVVWCTGGEPAAGVAPGTPDRGYECGKRWGERALAHERVCIDRHPDYPVGGSDAYACRYEQEQGTARVCQKRAGARSRSLEKKAVPACWLDSDCRSTACDRGACRCTDDRACDGGRCVGGWCARSGS